MACVVIAPSAEYGEHGQNDEPCVEVIAHAADIRGRVSVLSESSDSQPKIGIEIVEDMKEHHEQHRYPSDVV